MVAVVRTRDTAPLPASSRNSPANSLVPALRADVNPLESADPKHLATAHSNRLTQILSPFHSAVTKNRGYTPHLFVTTLLPRSASGELNPHRITFLRRLCTNQRTKNPRISRRFI